jgi:hypothetical protein
VAYSLKIFAFVADFGEVFGDCKVKKLISDRVAVSEDALTHQIKSIGLGSVGIGV